MNEQPRLEKTEIEVGFIPILCSAPIILAHARGIFEKNGLYVRLRSAPGWSGIKELIAYDKIHVAHMLSPMPLACNLGIDGKRSEIKLAAIQNVNGQAITLAARHMGIAHVQDMKGFTFGVPYRFSMHYYLLCYYLAQHGVNPLKDVTIIEVAPPNMPHYLEQGWVDGILAPEPFNQIPVTLGTGFIHVLSKDIWDGHPCCSLATTQSFASANPNTYRALLRSTLEAEMALHNADLDERRAIARSISNSEHLNLDNALPAEQVLSGEFPDGKGGYHRVHDRIDFVPHPFTDYGNWMLSQMQRWGQLDSKVDYREIVESTFDSKDTRDIAAAMGYSPDKYPETSIIGFDSENPFAYMSEQPFCGFQEKARENKRRDIPASIKERLGEINSQLAEAVGGNLDVTFPGEDDDELGRLEELLGEMVLNTKFARLLLGDRNAKLKANASELRHSEAQLADSYVRLEDIIRSNPAIIYTCKADEDFRATFISERVRKQLGYEPDDFREHPSLWTDGIHQDDRDRVTGELAVLFEQGHHEYEYRLRNKAGEYRWIRDECRLICGADGKPREISGYLTDITKRKRAEQESERTQKFIQTIIDGAAETLMVIDREYSIVFANKGIREMTGGIDPVAAGLKCYQITQNSRTPCESEEHPCPLKQILATKAPVTCERMHYRSEGDVVPVAINAAPIFDEAGEVVQIIESCRDITDQRRAALEREKLLHDTMDRAKELEGLYRVAKAITESSSMEELFKRIATIITPAWRYPEITRVRIVFDGHEHVCEPFEPTRWKQAVEILVDGETRGVIEVYLIKNRPGLDEGLFLEEERSLLHGIAKMVGVAVERLESATRLKSRDEKLREYKMAVDQSADGIALADLDGNIRFVNHAWANMHGYSVDELVGRHLDVFHTKEQLQTEVLPFNELLKQTGSNEGEIGHARRDGTTFPTWMTSTLLMDEDHEPVGIMGIARDITVQKEMETQLSLNRRLETVGQLAAGIAHEINTPTQFVSDSAHFLKEAFGDQKELILKYRQVLDALGREAGHEQLLGEIKEAEETADLEYLDEHVPGAFERCIDGLSRISTIVGAMKEFAHPDHRKKSSADLNQALQATLTITRNEYKYVADVETELGKLPLVPCYIGDLNQVFLNLLVNAAHAIGDVVGNSGAKGVIRVRSAHDGDTVRIEIEDTGCGIPAAIRERIFDPFFTTKDVGKGNGQGLAIAHSIIMDKHNGSLTCQSEEGKGSTFIIRLPVDGKGEKKTEAAS